MLPSATLVMAARPPRSSRLDPAESGQRRLRRWTPAGQFLRSAKSIARPRMCVSRLVRTWTGTVRRLASLKPGRRVPGRRPTSSPTIRATTSRASMRSAVDHRLPAPPPAIGLTGEAVLTRGFGSSWTTTEPTYPVDNAGGGYLEGISCSAASACAAVGYYLPATVALPGTNHLAQRRRLVKHRAGEPRLGRAAEVRTRSHLLPPRTTRSAQRLDPAPTRPRGNASLLETIGS